MLTACAALPLVLLGAEVTTRKVGMADEVGFRAPWHLLQLHLEDALKAKGLGFVIEHSHRVAGFVVGTCAIVLAVGLWRSAPQRWLRWLGVAALAGVCLQGLLGIFRVNLDRMLGRDLALIHGCFGQMVFALLVSVALLTSRGWQEDERPSDPERSGRLAWLALLVTGLVLVQLVFGALLRHKGTLLSQRLHLLTAFAVVAGVAWLLKATRDDPAGHRRLARLATLMAVMVAFQLTLGVESWMIRFSAAGLTAPEQVIWHRDLIRTAHVLVGSLILAASATATLEAFRRAARATACHAFAAPDRPGASPPSPGGRESMPPTKAGQLEGVA